MFQFQDKTNSTTEFTGAIAQNAAVTIDHVLPGCLAGMNGNARGLIRAFTIVSKENLAWELELWNSATHGTTTDTDAFIGRWSFAAADATQEGAAGLFRYYIDGLGVPYLDADNTGKLHLSLVNRSAASKTAGANGAVVVKFNVEVPVLGWAGH